MRRATRCTAVTLVLGVACASAAGSSVTRDGPAASSSAPSVSLPELPAGTLHGYVVHDTSLDAATLSTDALDPAALLAVLTHAGFRTGLERRFTARGKPLTEVSSRVLRFGSAEGARSYVDWIRSHGTDLLGARTVAASPPAIAGSIAFSHGVSGCCTKDTFQYFAAWTRGAYAITLRVGGPHAGLRTATPLARALDDRVRKGI